MTTYSTTSEAYLATVRALLSPSARTVAPRGLTCRELYNYSFLVLEPTDEPIRTHNELRNAAIAVYHKKEMTLYATGELQASVWAEKASAFWGKIANPDGTINSNYGYLTYYDRSLPKNLTQWEWARESLKLDPDTRQAFIRFSHPRHQWIGNKDQVCTMHMMFANREGTLHGTTVMRSNDVVRGLVYDMPWFVSLLLDMAEELDLAVGTYTHFVHSMHLYERDIEVARSMIDDHS